MNSHWTDNFSWNYEKWIWVFPCQVPHYSWLSNHLYQRSLSDNDPNHFQTLYSASKSDHHLYSIPSSNLLSKWILLLTGIYFKLSNGSFLYLGFLYLEFIFHSYSLVCLCQPVVFFVSKIIYFLCCLMI